MKKKVSNNPSPLCLSCGGVVISNIGTSAQGYFGYECSACGIKYILPPPVNKEHWDRMKKIFDNGLAYTINEKGLLIASLLEKIKTPPI